MGELKKWARDNNPNLKLSDGESVVVQFTGSKIVADPFNPGKEKIQYEVIVEGKIKYWASASGKTAEFFDHVKKGDFVKISATGDGMKRRYSLEDSIDASGTLTKSEAEKISDGLSG